MDKITVGLTGIPGSGKSRVMTILKKIGWAVLSSDEIAHSLLLVPSIKRKIFQKFPECQNISKEVDRQILGKIVFLNPKKKKILEDILHPPIIQRIKNELKKFRRKTGGKYLVVEVPLLFEKKLENLFDVIVFVDCPKTVASSRLKKSRKWSKNYFEQILKNQISPEVKRKKSNYLIVNSTNKIANLWREVKKFQRWIKDRMADEEKRSKS